MPWALTRSLSTQTTKLTPFTRSHAYTRAHTHTYTITTTHRHMRLQKKYLRGKERKKACLNETSKKRERVSEGEEEKGLDVL